MQSLFSWIGNRLAQYLSQERPRGEQVGLVDLAVLAAALRPGDVLLVEGNTRISVAIKYLTQSTWSHAALYIGGALESVSPGGGPHMLIEANIREGVRAVPLSHFTSLHTRICRPVGLSAADAQAVVAFAVSRLGDQYDLKNVIDLGRYLLPTPPVPARFRRRMIAFGSGDPTRAICSTLIAQAFESVKFPILPDISRVITGDPASVNCYEEIYRIRHHSLFAPRDFDVSPYFAVIKPSIVAGFDYRAIVWDTTGQTSPA